MLALLSPSRNASAQTATSTTPHVTLARSTHGDPDLQVAPAPSGDDGFSTPLDRYRQRALELRYEFRFFGGGWIVYRNGRSTELGLFAKRGHQVFAGSPGALEAIDDYRRRNIAGVTVFSIGYTALLLGTVWLFYSFDSNDRNAEVAPLSLMIAGAATATAGMWVVLLAPRHLSRAVDVYNTDLYERLRSGWASTRPNGWTLSAATRF